MIVNLLLLTGEDTYRLHERLRFLRDGFRKKYPDGEIETLTSPERGDGHDQIAALTELQNTVCTPNLFGGKRLAICEAGWWSAEKFDAATKNGFFESLPGMADCATLLVCQPKLDKRLKWSKFLKEHARVENFDPLDEQELLRWLEEFTEKNGGKIGRNEVRTLIDRCGTNLWHLTSELQKLIVATDGTAITTELIKKLTIASPELEVWDFLEQLSRGNTTAAIDQFRSLLQMGQPIQQLFGMLQREVRVHAQIRAGLDQNMNERDIAGRTKLHPFVVKKTMGATKRLSNKKIAQMYDELFDIERRIKSGGITTTSSDSRALEVAIEKFIVITCQK